jgi:uncharacterized protein YqcC (DUF446 family)
MSWLLIAATLVMIGGVLYSFRRASLFGQSSSSGNTAGAVVPPSAGRQAMLDAILVQLDLVEAELRRLGWWLDQPDPPPERDPSTLYAGLSFPQWLQYEFLPRARLTVGDNSPPTSSMVGVMAMRQYDYHSIVEEALPLWQRSKTFLNSQRGGLSRSRKASSAC